VAAATVPVRSGLINPEDAAQSRARRSV